MPETFAIWATTAIASAFTVTGWAGISAIYYTAYAAAAAGIAYGLSSLSSKLTQKQLEDNRDFAISANVRSAAQPQIIIYGKTVVGSLVAYANTMRIAGSTDNFELWFVDVVAGHPCEDVIDLYYDNEVITDAAHIDWGNNRVDAGTYGITKNGEYALKVWKRLGASNTVVTELDTAFADITTAFKGQGLTWVATRMASFSTSQGLWETRGTPSLRRFLVKGKKDIYDPRLDVTPGASPNNVSYQAWTDNPILCIADFLRVHCQVADARIDWASVETQADICDALVTIPGATTEKRYTCNGAASLGATRENTLRAMLTSCMGRLVRSSGKYQIIAGAYEAASITITEEDIVGSIGEETNVSSSDRYNSVKGLYINRLDGYQEMPFYAVKSAAYITEDNAQTLWRDISLPFTTGEYEAQRIAFKHVLQSRMKLTLTIPLRWTGLQITPGSVVDVTYNGINKTMRCTSWKMGGDAPFSVVLREDSSAAWADPTSGQYTTRTAAGVITQPSEAINVPTVGAPPLSNVLPEIYGDFENAWRNDFTLQSGGGPTPPAVSLDSTYKFLGTRSLRVVGTVTNTEISGVGFANQNGGNTQENTVNIRANRRWLVVCALRPDTTDSLNPDYYFQAHTTAGLFASSSIATLTDVDTWVYKAFVLDLTASSNTAIHLTFVAKNNATLGTTPIVNVDCVMMIDVTDSPWYDATTFPTAFVPGVGSPSKLKRTLISTADVSRASTTTLADDTYLRSWLLEPATEFVIEGTIRVTAGATPDFKFMFAFTNAAQSSKSTLYGEDGTGTSISLTSIGFDNSSTVINGGATEIILNFTMTVLTHATLESQVRFQWAQNTSNASACVVKKGSYLRLVSKTP